MTKVLSQIREHYPPRWNSPCRSEETYPPRSSNQSGSTRRAQLSGVVTVRLYVDSLFSDCLPLPCGRTAPELSEEEGSYASRVYRWFLEMLKS